MGVLCALFGHDYGVLVHPFSAIVGGEDFVAEARATCNRCGHVCKERYSKEKEKILKDREEWEALHRRLEHESS